MEKLFFFFAFDEFRLDVQGERAVELDEVRDDLAAIGGTRKSFDQRAVDRDDVEEILAQIM